MRVPTVLSGLIICITGAMALGQDDADIFDSLWSLGEETNCSAGATARVAELKQLVEEGRRLDRGDEDARLRDVLRFYYRHIRLMPDSRAWGRVDYWASPAETLCRGDGDAEDFAIAQFFTLAWMGVPENRLRLVYATSDVLGPVILLLYYPPDGGARILTDRDIWDLETFSRAGLLEPVYAFNTQTFWLVRKGWHFAPAGDAQRIQQWRRILRSVNLIRDD